MAHSVPLAPTLGLADLKALPPKVLSQALAEVLLDPTHLLTDADGVLVQPLRATLSAVCGEDVGSRWTNQVAKWMKMYGYRELTSNNRSRILRGLAAETVNDPLPTGTTAANGVDAPDDEPCSPAQARIDAARLRGQRERDELDLVGRLLRDFGPDALAAYIAIHAELIRAAHVTLGMRPNRVRRLIAKVIRPEEDEG